MGLTLMRTELIQLWAISRIRCAPSGWGPKGSECKCFEVLHNGGEMKLVARAGKSPEPQPLEAVVCLQVREAHFNTLPFVSRLGKRLCLHLPSCDIAGVLMDIARDLARIGRGAALRSYWAHVAVPLRGAVQQRASVVHGAAGLKQFPIWADVGPALPVPVEVRTGEDAVLPITHLPYRDVRDNFLPLDQPAEELARPVGRVRGEPPWFQIKALFCSIQHGLCRGNFIIGASRRRLDIHDHGILDIDEVVQPVSELYALVGLGCPGRLGIRRRDHLGWLALITALSFALGSTTLVVILGIAISRRFGFECRKILSHRTLSLLLLSPIEFIGRLAVITACVRLHDARIHGKSLAFDETHLHRSDDDALENVAQNIALTEPVQSVLGEGRVVGNGVIEIEPAEPSVCEMEPHLLA